MKKLIYLFIVFFQILETKSQIPTDINPPVNGEGWSYNAWGINCNDCQTKCGLSNYSSICGTYCTHCSSGGIGQSDDTNAWDINLNTPSHNFDNLKPVYAIENGIIDTRGTWGGNGAGQILIKHMSDDGTEWFSSYLHMTNKDTFVAGERIQKGQYLGRISNVGLNGGPQHLHFAVYTLNQTGKLISFYPTILNNNGLQLNFGSIINAGNKFSQKEISIIFRIPKNNGSLSNSNPIEDIRIGEADDLTYTNLTHLGDGYYIMRVSLPSVNSWTNGESYDISFKVNFQNPVFNLNAFGDNQVKFSNGNFNDTDRKWFKEYTRRAALYGFLGGFGNSFGNDFSNVDFATAARLVVNAAIKLRLGSTNDAHMTNAFAQTLASNIPISEDSYNYFQILQHWGYNIPSAITPQTTIKVNQLTEMLMVGFGINSSTTNTLLNAINQTPSTTCFFSDNLLKTKYVKKTYKNSVGREYTEPILSCGMNNNTNVSRATLAKLLVNVYEFKYQVNFSILPVANARINSTNTTINFQVLGLKKEFSSTPTGSLLNSSSSSAVYMTSGQFRDFSFPEVTVDGQQVSCYWSVDGGTITPVGGSPYFQSIKWTAPSVTSSTTYHLYRYATTATGYADETVIDIVVSPVSNPTVVNISVPSSIDFGNTTVGSSTDRTLTITNPSSSTAKLTGTVSNVNGVGMTILSGSQTLNIAPGQSQTLTLRFNPSSAGSYTNNISVSGNFSGGSKSILLTGSASTVTPTLTYSRIPDQTYSLLDTKYGEFSEAYITVSNYSGVTFHGSFDMVGLDYSAGILNGSGGVLSIPSGTSKDIWVRFTPTSNGTKLGTLSITGSATNTPGVFHFSTVGTNAPTSGCVTANLTTLTKVVNLSTSGWREFGRFTLTNTSSTLPANITNFSLPTTFFRILGYQGTQFSLNPNETREFVVDINPIASQGYYSGVVVIGTQVNGCNIINIDLRGTPSVTALNKPELIAPIANYEYPYLGFPHGFYLDFRKMNVDGLAKYRIYLIDITTNEILFNYYDAGNYTGYQPTQKAVFQTDAFWLPNIVRSKIGHKYGWRIRAESLSDPNIYSDSELGFFSAENLPLCETPTDFTISNITKNSVDLNWIARPTENGYSIETSTDNGATFTEWTNNFTSNPPLTVPNLLNSQIYKIRVVAKCNKRNGNYPINEYTTSTPSISKEFTTLADCSGETASISPTSQQTICQGASTSFTASAGSGYQWYKNDLPINRAVSQTYAANQAGSYKAKVTYSNGCEVFSSSMAVSLITKPVVTISSASAGICSGGSTTLTATSIASANYQWVKDDINVNNANSNTLTATSSGVYKVNFTQNGCNFSTDLYNLPTLANPSISVTGNNNLTVGNTLNLSASGANSYSWTGPNGFTSQSSSFAIPNIQLNNAGNYLVNGVGANGCSATVDFNVNISVPCNLPSATITGTQTINTGQNANLSVALTGVSPWNITVSGVTYNNILSSPKTITVNPISSTTYTLSKVENNCGLGTFGGNAIITVNQTCQLPDLIVSDIIVTKYTSDKIYYQVKVKNIGNQSVNLDSFSFSTYGSSNALKDNADAFKHAMFLGGGDLAKNQTITYNVSASMNYASNQHYFLVLADHYGMIAECDENNNMGSKVVKPCSHSGNQTLTGNYNGLVATNGKLILDDVTANANTLFLGSSVETKPTSNFQNRPTMIQIGNCLNVAGTSAIQSESIQSKSEKDILEFQDSGTDLVVNYSLNQYTSLNISIWDLEAQTKLSNISQNQSITAGNHTLDLSNQNLVSGKSYIVHFETENGYFAKVVEL